VKEEGRNLGGNLRSNRPCFLRFGLSGPPPQTHTRHTRPHFTDSYLVWHSSFGGGPSLAFPCVGGPLMPYLRNRYLFWVFGEERVPDLEGIHNWKEGPLLACVEPKAIGGGGGH